jgi:anti-sigma regulatory factor (Ser/Thr protein kinase)
MASKPTRLSTESTGRPGRFHEVGFYRSDAEFRALIVPFVEEGLACGQPVIIGYDDRKASLLRSWLHDPAAVTFFTGTDLYATPARAIASYWKIFELCTAAGATQIRIAGDVPHEGNGGRFAGWDRYESAANTVWDRFPVWSRCLYDATTAAPRVLDIAGRTHPRIVLPSGQFRDSGLYQHAADFQPLRSDPDPLERLVPALELTDPSPVQARRAVTSIGHGQVPDTVLQDLEIGVTEAISNARLHGRPPVTARIWAVPGRMLVDVHHTGPGPDDPLAGLVPAWGDPEFRGSELWLMHMLDLDVALIPSRDGFTIRLAAGRPALAQRSVHRRGRRAPVLPARVHGDQPGGARRDADQLRPRVQGQPGGNRLPPPLLGEQPDEQLWPTALGPEDELGRSRLVRSLPAEIAGDSQG